MSSKTDSVRAAHTNLSTLGTTDVASAEATTIPAVDPLNNDCDDRAEQRANHLPTAPPAHVTRRGLIMNSIVSAAAVASATAIPNQSDVTPKEQLLSAFDALDPKLRPAALVYIRNQNGDASRSASASLERAEQVVDLLRTRYIREGWKIDEEAAERALAYCRAYAADGSDPDDEREAAFDFFTSHGQSLDWVLDGQHGALICGLAKQSERAHFLAATVDPIFPAIDLYQRADAACSAVSTGMDIPDALADHRGNAFHAVMRTRPTSPAGLTALTTWIREQAAELSKTGSMLFSEDLHTLSATIDDATRGMSGLEPWSPPAEILADGPDPIFAAIEAHRTAVADHAAAVQIECDLDETLPEDKRRSVLTVWEEEIVETDDPRWPAAIHSRTDTSIAADDAAMALLEVKPTTVAGASALLKYVEVQDDYLFPDNLVDDDGKGTSFGRAIAGHVGEVLSRMSQSA
jgi:hypothetical protein